MEKFVFSGKTEEEAKDKALDELNLDEEYVLFLSSKEKDNLFEVEVITREEVIKNIKEFLEKIVNLMGINCNIEYKYREGISYFNINSKHAPVLIGKNGKGVAALQAITNQMLKQELGVYFKIQIDVSDYKRKKEARIEKLAKFTAKDVAMAKCSVKLSPMNAYERRIVHNVLADSLDVTTKSYGEEPNRYVVISPKE